MILQDSYKQTNKIEISHRTIIFIFLFLILLWFLYSIREVILLFFVALITMAALNPIIDKMEKFKIPRPLSILIFYLLFLSFLVGSIVSIMPAIISQSVELFKNLPNLVEKLSLFNIQIQPNDYTSQLVKIPGNAFKIISTTFSNIILIFTYMVISYYLLLERKNLYKHIHFLFKGKEEIHVKEFIDRFEAKIGGWVRGELMLMLIVGLMSYVGLRLLDLQFAIPLAIIAGFLELVPNIGPTISMIPAAIVGFAVSPIMGLTVVILYFVVQQLENNIIVPKIMQASTGVNPLVIILSLMIGLKIGGVIGAVLAVPLFLTAELIIREIYNNHFSS